MKTGTAEYMGDTNGGFPRKWCEPTLSAQVCSGIQIVSDSRAVAMFDQLQAA